jgi:hypothetical protein
VTLTAHVTPGATGSVNFVDLGTTMVLGSGTLNTSGVATLSLSNLTVGSHVILALYGGDGNFGGSNSASQTETVTQATTTATLGASGSPSVSGQSVTFTATVQAVSPAGGVPTGTVNFKEGSLILGSGTLNTSGVATFTTTTLAIATHSIVAQYLGTSGYAGSSSSTVSQVVNKANVNVLTPIPSVNPAVTGQLVTFTTIVSAAFPGSGTPTGTVVFKDGTTTLGSGTLNGSGMASFTTNTLALGTHSITAQYAGDSKFNTNTSAAVTETIAPVGTSPTATTVTALPGASIFGQPVTFTATVTGGGTPTGTVSFFDGAAVLANLIGTGTVGAGGTASVTTSALTGGTHTITAVYSGDLTFASSTGTLASFVVSRAATATTVTAVPGASVFGQAVTFRAFVTGPGGTPTGTVTFFDGVTPLGTQTLSGGSTTLSISTLSVSSHTISATYNADTNFTGSTGTLSPNFVVSRAFTTTTLSAAPMPSALGFAVTFTAKVTANSPSTAAVTSGFVTFKDGATTIAGNVALNASGVATFTTTTLALGTHSISVIFTTNTNFLTSISNTVSQQVLSGKPSTTAVTESTATSVFGQGVTFTATVTGTGGIPTGTVTFFSLDGSLTPTTIALTAGKATFVISGFAVGAHTVSAKYNGDTVFIPNTATTTATLTVTKNNTTTRLTSSAPTSTLGSPVTFTAAVAANAPGSGIPTGQVQFTVDGVVQTPVTLNASGVATLTLSTLTAGSHTITATYLNGDAHFNAGTTTSLVQTVQTVTHLVAALPAGTIVSIGSNFSILVNAENAQNATVANFTGMATLTLVSAPTGGAILSGTTSIAAIAPTATFVNGVATFSGLKVTVAGSYVVRITSGTFTTTLTIPAAQRQA